LDKRSLQWIVVQRHPIERQAPWADDTQVWRITTHRDTATDMIEILLSTDLSSIHQEN
jgi:hypothetical protein